MRKSIHITFLPSADGTSEARVELLRNGLRAPASKMHTRGIGNAHVCIQTERGAWAPSCCASEMAKDAFPIQATKRSGAEGALLPVYDGQHVEIARREGSSLVTFYTPPDYHRIFCAHDKARYAPCAACRRDKAEAAGNWLLFCAGKLR